MFYYLYQITNLVNNKIYVGVHKTKDMNDGYMGSGKVIKSAIEKYGIENFKKDILETFENSESMYEREKEIVTEEFLEREDVYNLRRGGFGGFEYIHKNGLNNSTKSIEQLRRGGEKLALRYRTDNDFANKMKEDISERIKTQYNSGIRSSCFKNSELQKTLSKRAHTEDVNKKRSDTIKNLHPEFQKGTNNSQYGTTWVWHELFGNKKIKKNKIVEYLDQGWYKTYKPGYKV